MLQVIRTPFWHKPKINETIVFENGMVGCVTKAGKICLVTKAGWTYSAIKAPNAVEYCAKHMAVHVENNFPQYNDTAIAA